MICVMLKHEMTRRYQTHNMNLYTDSLCCIGKAVRKKFACFSVNIDLDINAWSWQNFPQLVHYLNNPSSDSQTKYECE